MPTRTKDIEDLAEKIWRAEAFRITGRDRTIAWSDVAVPDQDRYLFVANRILGPDEYLVWSNEHRAWWRADSAGYTTSSKAAGRYTREDAIDICRWARNGWRKHDQRPDELPIRVADVPEDLL